MLGDFQVLKREWMAEYEKQVYCFTKRVNCIWFHRPFYMDARVER